MAVPGNPTGHFEVEPPPPPKDSARAPRGVDRVFDLERQLRRFQELDRIAEAVNAGVLLVEVLDLVYESMDSTVPYQRMGCALLEEDGETLRAVWARSSGSEIHLPVGYTAPIKGSSLESVLESGAPRILNDLEAYLAEHPGSESTRRLLAEGFRSSLTGPLVAMGGPVGFLFFSNTERGSYRDVHVEALNRVSRQLSQIIEKSRLYEELLETKRELERANGELARLASQDDLTGVANRRSFEATLDLEWRRAMRRADPLSMLLVDIDHFKSYNDRYGHQLGDECLRRVAQCLSSSLSRAGDFVARVGGEEFAIIVPNAGAKEIGKLAEMLRGKIAGLRIPSPASRFDLTLTVSLGGATTLPSLEASPARLFFTADQALYAAKGGGRNRSRVIDLTEDSEKEGSLAARRAGLACVPEPLRVAAE